MKSPGKVLLAGVATLATVGALAGCSASGSGDSSGDSKVHIVVAPVLPGATADALSALADRVKEFEKANPDIDVKAVEYQWTGSTFAAELAGGTLPDVFNVPFTDSKTLADNGQLADITKDFDETSAPRRSGTRQVLDVAKGDDGKVYGIPWGPYAMALSYNRDIFTQAGLDPDKPPDHARRDPEATPRRSPRRSRASPATCR